MGIEKIDKERLTDTLKSLCTLQGTYLKPIVNYCWWCFRNYGGLGYNGHNTCLVKRVVGELYTNQPSFNQNKSSDNQYTYSCIYRSDSQLQRLTQSEFLPYFRRRWSWAGVGTCASHPVSERWEKLRPSVLPTFCRRTTTGMGGLYLPCNVQPYQAADPVAAPVSGKQRRVGRNKRQ